MATHIRVIFSFLIIVCWHFSVKAQNEADENRFKYQNFRVESGMPSNQLYDTHQDKNGNLWIASDKGVVLFDGKDVIISLDSRSGLTDNTVFKIYEDYKGRIWFITHRGGVCYYDGYKVVEPRFNNELLNILSGKNYVLQMHVTKDGIYFSNRYACDYYLKTSPDEKQILKIELRGPATKANYNSLLWVTEFDDHFFSGKYSASKEIKKKFPDSDTTIRIMPVKEKDFSVTYHNVGQRNFARHEAYIGDTLEVLVFFSKALIRSKLTKNLYSYVFTSPIVSLYVRGNNFYFGLGSGGILHFKDRVDNEHLVGLYFKEFIFSSIKKTSQNAFCLTTLYNGLMLLPSFNSINYSLPKVHIANDLAQPLYINNDTLAIIEKSTSKNDQPSLLSIRTLQNNGAKDIEQIWFNMDPYRWATTPVIWFNAHKFISNYSQYQFKENKINLLQSWFWDSYNTYHAIETLYSYNNNTIKSATRNGLGIVSNDTMLFYSADFNFNEEIYDLLLKTENEYYLGIEAGLVTINTANHDVFEFTQKELQFPVKKIDRDIFNRIWVATDGNGVLVLEDDNILFKLNKENSLSSDFCKSLEIKDSIAFIGTENGLNRITFSKNKILKSTFIGSADGLSSDYIDHIYIDRNKVYTQSGRNLDRIDMAKLYSPPSCKTIITHVDIADSTYSYDVAIEKPLAYNIKALKFTFRTNTLLNNNKIWYKYRLLGKDSTWTYTHDREAIFLNVVRGDYTFEVYGRNGNGQWSKTPACFNFKIPKPIYLRWWFILICGLLLTGLIWGIVYYSKYRQQKRFQMQHELTTSNIRALKSQINPHFMFNALNSIRYFLINNHIKDADKYLVKFSALLRGLLRDTERSKVSLKEENELIQNYLALEEIRLVDKLEWTVTIDPEINTKLVFLPPMLIQPLLENSVWHGFDGLERTGRLSVNFSLKNSNLICEITDDGKGFNANDPNLKAKNTGLGLKNIKERFNLLSQVEEKNYTISITSKPHFGTKVILNFPQ